MKEEEEGVHYILSISLGPREGSNNKPCLKEEWDWVEFNENSEGVKALSGIKVYRVPGKTQKSHKLSIILLLIKTHADFTQTHCSFEYEGHPLENKCG